ncbi:MAG: MMPL family transporter [Planctomycetota bacterium]
MPRVTDRFIGLLVAWRVPLLLLGIVAAVLAFFPARGLHFDRSIENMFAPADPLLPPYGKLKRTFGGNEVVVAVYVDEELFHPDGRGIKRLGELSGRLREVPGVKDVLSLDQPLEMAGESELLADRAKALFEGYTHGAGGKTSAVVCMLDPKPPDNTTRSETIERLRGLMATLPPGMTSGMITGEPVMVEDGFNYVERDGRVLGWATTLLLSLTIVLCFRSLRWVIVPIAVVQLTLLLTRATLVLSGLELSMVSSMLTAIVTVVGVATVVHVIVRFREARERGLSQREALLYVGPLLVAPVFWACATDAAGFSSLMVAKVGPIQDFGLMMAIGAMLVLLSVVLLVPGTALLGRFDPDPKRAWGENRLDRELERTVRWVERRPMTIGLTTLVVAGAAAAGAYRLEVETDFTRNFRSSSPIVRSYQFVEDNLGGAGVWDVILPAPKTLNWNYLTRVRRLEERLRAEVLVPGSEGGEVPGLTKVISMADVVVAGSTKDLDNVRTSTMRNAVLRTGIRRLTEAMPGFVEALHGEDPLEPGRHYLRVMIRARERQPAAQKLHLIDQVTRISREEFPPTDDAPGAEVTGFFVLLTNLIKSIIRDQWLTFGVATAGIGLMLLVVFRSPVLALVGLVPNVLPILIVTGLMGWLGLKINMGAAMIAAVSMGLSIDSEIHYIVAFRRARAEGKSLDQTLRVVHQSVGRAVVFSTLALIVGFTVLVTSQFVPTIYFGVLVSLTMLGGLAGNLVVLPLLLTWVTPERAAA